MLKCNYTVDELGRENILNWLEDTASGVDASLPTNYALQFVESGCWEEITSDEQGMRIFEAWLEADEEIHKYRLQQKLQGANQTGTRDTSLFENGICNARLFEEDFDCIDLKSFEQLVFDIFKTMRFSISCSNNALYLLRRWHDLSMIRWIANFSKSYLPSKVLQQGRDDHMHALDGTASGWVTLGTPNIKSETALSSTATPSTLKNTKKRKLTQPAVGQGVDRLKQVRIQRPRTLKESAPSARESFGYKKTRI